MMGFFLWTVFLIDFRVLHLDRVSASWLFVGRVEHGAVAATSKYGFHVELVRATGFLSCVDAVEQFFQKSCLPNRCTAAQSNLLRITLVPSTKL